MIHTNPNNPQVLSPLVRKARDELEHLLAKELGENVSRFQSYAVFRVSYLRAVSQLRPKFFEDLEDFLDKDLRQAEWYKRVRFNELKKAWIRYDKIAPDKARDLGTEDQEVENDLDVIEEEIQEEWQDFCEELLDMFDDEDDDEDYGDEEDLADLDQWRAERKRMRQDASLLKRRILERTMQRRAREEAAEKKLAVREQEKLLKVTQEKAWRANKTAAVHAAALEAISPTRKVLTIRWGGDQVRQISSRKLYSSTSKLIVPLSGDDDHSTSSPTRASTIKEDEDEQSSCKHESKKKSSSSSNGKKSKSKHKDDESSKSKSREKDSEPSKKDKESVEMSSLKDKKKKRESKHPEPRTLEVPTPTVKRRNPVQLPSVPLSCPRIDENDCESPRASIHKSSVPESDSPAKFLRSPLPSRWASLSSPLSGVVNDVVNDVKLSSPQRRGSIGTSQAEAKKVSPKNGVSSLRAKFSNPTTPKLPVTPSISKYKYGFTGSLPMAPSLAGGGVKGGKDSVSKKLPSLKSILETLEKHETVSTNDLVNALTGLHELVKNSVDSWNDFAGGQGCTLLSNILRIHYQSNAAVTEACHRALIPLAESEKCRDAFAVLGVIEDIMVGMLFHRESTGVSKYGLDALSSFASIRKYQDWIVESNGIQVVLKTQSAFLSDAGVQTACFRCMTQLVVDNVENSRQLSAAGGIKYIMGVINLPEHEGCVELHKAAIQTLAILAKTDEVNRGAIAKEDGIRVILLAMETFPTDGELQQRACQALCALATDHAQNCKSIHNQSGLRIVSKAMKDHSMHEGAQEASLSLLRLMTDDEDISKAFADVGGIDRVLVAMRNFETIEIHEQGCLTLCNMSFHEEHKETIRNLGGIRMIVAAMRFLKNSTFVQKSGCRALDSLAMNDQSKVTIAASGGITAMLTAMQHHTSVAGLQALAITALRKLATVNRNRNIMKTNDGIETVERAMLNYPTHAYLQRNGEALVKLLDPTRILIQPKPLPANTTKVTNEGAPRDTRPMETTNAASTKMGHEPTKETESSKKKEQTPTAQTDVGQRTVETESSKKEQNPTKEVAAVPTSATAQSKEKESSHQKEKEALVKLLDPTRIIIQPKPVPVNITKGTNEAAPRDTRPTDATNAASTKLGREPTKETESSEKKEQTNAASTKLGHEPTKETKSSEKKEQPNSTSTKLGHEPTKETRSSEKKTQANAASTKLGHERTKETESTMKKEQTTIAQTEVGEQTVDTESSKNKEQNPTKEVAAVPTLGTARSKAKEQTQQKEEKGAPAAGAEEGSKKKVKARDAPGHRAAHLNKSM